MTRLLQHLLSKYVLPIAMVNICSTGPVIKEPEYLLVDNIFFPRSNPLFAPINVDRRERVFSTREIPMVEYEQPELPGRVEVGNFLETLTCIDNYVSGKNFLDPDIAADDPLLIYTSGVLDNPVTLKKDPFQIFKKTRYGLQIVSERIRRQR